MNISNYIDMLRGHGRADRTIAEYVKYVRRAARYAADHGRSLDDLDAHQLRAWADADLPHSWASRKQARTALTHYYHDRPDQPWRAIRVPRKPRPSYRGLAFTDATRLRDGARLVGGRAGLATLLLLYTGMRASEAASMRWDGHADGRIRWWRTKTSDWHQVPCHPYLDEVLTGARDGDGPMFVGNNGRAHVSASTVWSWVRTVGGQVGVEVSPQQVRVTAGTMVLEHTGDLDAACEFLGHTDPAVTRAHYTLTSPRRLTAAVAALDFEPAGGGRHGT